MKFYIDTGDSPGISDKEISDLLTQVYVDGGFTDKERAVSLFEPSAVRKRGRIICAREKQKMILAGMVIVVYPFSPARVFAEENETEMHLLAVKPEYRGNGLGRLLVNAAVEDAAKKGYSKMLLWTQSTMFAAHGLYESCGFVRIPGRDFDKGNRNFRFYEKILSAST